ncbi:MAG: hypothetical protein L0228_00365 [Planctomycetes bacterium]|nr:hypothetical protein [Planctomycetota bacterium]
MHRSSLNIGFALVLLLCVRAFADESNEDRDVQIIPLDQIWGYNLPGTKDIAGIPLPEKPGFGQSLDFLRRQREHNIEQIRRALTAKHPTEQATPGFVLHRQPDFQTLLGASNRLRGLLHDHPKEVRVTGERYRAGEETTLVFFSHPLSYYMRLRNVERQDNEITVQYEFEPHTTPEVTVHFALIPLGKLPAGKYQVRFEQIPLAQKYRDIGFEPVEPDAWMIVCRPFSFEIIDLPEADEPAKGAVIPLDQIWSYQKMPGTRDAHELEPQLPDAGLMSDEEFIRRHQIQQILHSLSFRNRPKPGEKAGPAFVIIGTGKEALKNAADVFNKEKQPQQVLPADTDLTLVFYSYMCARYVRIASVGQSENVITVKYQIVAHGTQEMTTHFALIPIGKLPAGRVQVNVQQVESNDPFDQLIPPVRDPLRYVSDSFSFEVRR